MSPTDYRSNNESMLIGGEVCLWTEYADDDSIMPRLWSVYMCTLYIRVYACLEHLDTGNIGNFNSCHG